MKSILSAVIGATLALSAIQTYAQSTPAERPVSFAIESKTLAEALDQWAQQTGFQLFSPSWDIAKKLVAPTLKGKFTARQALEQLLKGSPLTYEFTDDRTVTVKARFQAASDIRVDDERSELRIARLGAEGATSSRTSVGGQVGDATPGNASVPSHASQSLSMETLDEIVVTGTHIRGSTAGTQALTISRSDIEKTGFTRVEDVLKSVPQNFAEISPGGRFATEGGSNLSRTNNDRVSSVDLRGLGAQSTLTLIDGMRQAGSVGGRVFDISAIPLQMVERVEVATGGHSAVYGADAVAGVVNFVTRREYEGFETQVSYGDSDGGGARFQVGQLGGMTFDRGGFAFGYDYSHDRPLDLADVGLLSDQPIAAAGGIVEKGIQIQADTVRQSGLLSGHYRLTVGLEAFASALYTDTRFDSEERVLRPGAPADSVTSVEHPSHLLSVTAGLHIDISAWRATVSGATSTSRQQDDPSRSVTVGPTFTSTGIFLRDDKTEVSSASVVADGPLFDIGTLQSRLAVGIEALDEEFRGTQVFNGVSLSNTNNDRTVHSAFAEVLLPLFPRPSDSRGMLELTLAGRYDDYSDFGDTFNPQFGVTWEPIAGFRVLGSYSEAFRAPALAEMARSNSAFVIGAADPKSPSGATPLLIVRGENPDLDPETADTYTIGLEFQPASMPGALASLSYFNVKYRDRIEFPAVSFTDQISALTREDRYVELIDRTPDAAEAQAIVNGVGTFTNLTATPFNRATDSILTAFPTLAIFDDRRNNIAIDKVSGLDFILKSQLATPAGQLSWGLNATYTLEHKRYITATSPSISQINEVGKPADLRFRANVGWSSGIYGLFAFANYVDGYANPYSTPASEMGSWTTFDVALQLDFSEVERGALLNGLVATLSADNVFDKAPPRYTNSAFGILYDTTNADPFGRYVSVRVVKKW